MLWNAGWLILWKEVACTFEKIEILKRGNAAREWIEGIFWSGDDLLCIAALANRPDYQVLVVQGSTNIRIGNVVFEWAKPQALLENNGRIDKIWSILRAFSLSYILIILLLVVRLRLWMEFCLMYHRYYLLLLLLLHRCYSWRHSLLLFCVFKTLRGNHDYLILLTFTVTVDCLFRFNLWFVAEATRRRFAVFASCLFLFGSGGVAWRWLFTPITAWLWSRRGWCWRATLSWK